MLYEKLVELEKALEGEEDFAGGVSYYLSFDKMDSTISLQDSIKEQLIKLEVDDLLERDSKLNIKIINQPKLEMENLCNEWFIKKDILDRIVDMMDDEMKMYKFCDDYVYVSRGVVCEIYRVIEYKDERILVDFYLVD